MAGAKRQNAVRQSGGGGTLVRQWAMLRAIPRYPQRVTAAQVRARLIDAGFDVTQRTVERDLQALSLSFPLDSDERAKPYGWCWARDAAMEFAPGFTSPQAVALLLARTHLHALLPRSMQDELVPLFSMAEHALGGSAWRDWHARTAVLPMSLRLMPPKVDPSALATVQQALARRRCVTGHYRSKGATASRPVLVHPLGVIARGSVLYLIGTLFDYPDVRQLALHRLSNVSEDATPRCEPEGFEFQAYVRGQGSRFEPQGPVRLVARFTPTAAEHLFETPLSRDQTLTPTADGRVELAATVEDDQTLRWWLLAFGDQVEVVEPTPLRDRLARELANAASAYVSVPISSSLEEIA